ncbi:MAG: hypothetical protein AAGF11_42485 [Myxococcota bacterium]
MRWFLLSLLLLTACDDSKADEAPAPPPAKVDEAEARARAAAAARAQAAAVTPPPEPTFAEQIAERVGEVDAVPKAIDLFLTRYSDPQASVDEAARHQALDELVQFIAVAVVDPYGKGGLLESGAIGTAACMRSGKCDTGEPTLAAQEALAALESRGFKIVYAGWRKFDIVPNLDVMAQRLAPALPEIGVEYMQALMWDKDKVEGGAGEDGEIDPSDVAEGLLRWEALAGRDRSSYARRAKERAAAVAERYLRLCVPNDASSDGACVVAKAHYKSYRAFIKEHADSAYAPAVEHFVEQAKAAGSRLSAEQLAALVQQSVDKVGSAP